MHIASIVEKVDGKYMARVIGEPTLCGVGETRECAIKELDIVLAVKIAQGEIVMMDTQLDGIRGAAGILRDAEPGIDEELAELYRQREEDKEREFAQ